MHAKLNAQPQGFDSKLGVYFSTAPSPRAVQQQTFSRAGIRRCAAAGHSDPDDQGCSCSPVISRAPLDARGSACGARGNHSILGYQ